METVDGLDAVEFKTLDACQKSFPWQVQVLCIRRIKIQPAGTQKFFNHHTATGLGAFGDGQPENHRRHLAAVFSDQSEDFFRECGIRFRISEECFLAVTDGE